MQIHLTVPVRELRSLLTPEGNWHPLAYSRLMRLMQAQYLGVRSGCPQSIVDFVSFAYAASRLRLSRRCERRHKELILFIRNEAAALQGAHAFVLHDERMLLVEAQRRLYAIAQELTNAPPP